jgi:hypothetical protein
MKPLPDIATSAGFWAAIGTLWSVSGAWFTFVDAARASRKRTHEGILNLLTGIETELELVSRMGERKRRRFRIFKVR